MTRAQALKVIRGAGAENDRSLFVRTYTENRISYAVAMAAFAEGKSFGDSVRARDAAKSEA